MPGGINRYGPLALTGPGGLALPPGFTGRVVARSGHKVASLTWRDPSGAVVPHRAQGSYSGFLAMPYPAWDLVPVQDAIRRSISS